MSGTNCYWCMQSHSFSMNWHSAAGCKAQVIQTSAAEQRHTNYVFVLANDKLRWSEHWDMQYIAHRPGSKFEAFDHWTKGKARRKRGLRRHKVQAFCQLLYRSINLKSGWHCSIPYPVQSMLLCSHALNNTIASHQLVNSSSFWEWTLTCHRASW